DLRPETEDDPGGGTSHSMAKSITALAVGIVEREGLIRSLDAAAERYAPGLKGTVLGQTSVRNLLRMASGMKYEQTYDGSGDTPRFGKPIAAEGIEAALRTITEREREPGTRFYYASPHTVALGVVLANDGVRPDDGKATRSCRRSFSSTPPTGIACPSRFVRG